MLNQKLEALKRRIVSFDWYYEMSDDARTWRRGEEEKDGIIKDILKLTNEENSDLLSWWTGYIGDRSTTFNAWVTSILSR